LQIARFDPKQRRSVTLKEAEDVIAIAAKTTSAICLFVWGASRWRTRNAGDGAASGRIGHSPDDLHKRVALDGAELRELASDGLSSV